MNFPQKVVSLSAIKLCAWCFGCFPHNVFVRNVDSWMRKQFTRTPKADELGINKSEPKNLQDTYIHVQLYICTNLFWALWINHSWVAENLKLRQCCWLLMMQEQELQILGHWFETNNSHDWTTSWTVRLTLSITHLCRLTIMRSTLTISADQMEC